MPYSFSHQAERASKERKNHDRHRIHALRDRRAALLPGNDYIIGEPKPNGEVHGTANTVTDLRHELRLFLPANITRQLAATNDLDSWVAESLARTWVWHLNHEKFNAPAEDLAVAWKQATASQPRKKNSDDRR